MKKSKFRAFSMAEDQEYLQNKQEWESEGMKILPD